MGRSEAGYVHLLAGHLEEGVFPISCVAANKDILAVFNPGSHGSTFGGNPLACAVSVAALEVLEEEDLAERSLKLERIYGKLSEIKNPLIKEVRGRGLFIGVELTEAARPYCEKLKEEGLFMQKKHMKQSFDLRLRLLFQKKILNGRSAKSLVSCQTEK